MMASAAPLTPPAAAVLAGLPLSVETAPHYIGFNDQDIIDGNSLLKCAPPIRDKANQEGLFQGLKVRHQNPIAVMHHKASDTPCSSVLYYVTILDWSAWKLYKSSAGFRSRSLTVCPLLQRHVFCTFFDLSFM